VLKMDMIGNRGIKSIASAAKGCSRADSAQ